MKLLLVLFVLFAAAFAVPNAQEIIDTVHYVKKMDNVPESCNLLKKGLNTKLDGKVPSIRGFAPKFPENLNRADIHVVKCPRGVDAGPDRINFHQTRN